MAPAVLEREPVSATAEERAIMTALEQLLEGRQGQRDGTVLPAGQRHPARESDTAAVFRLVAPHGETIALPVVVVRLLRNIVHHLAHDRVVSIVPMHKQLTTQQAADLLHVSRPHLITLLERGELPYTRPGTHRRLQFGDVMAYKHRRDSQETEALDELARMSQDLGLYR